MGLIRAPLWAGDGGRIHALICCPNSFLHAVSIPACLLLELFGFVLLRMFQTASPCQMCGLQVPFPVSIYLFTLSSILHEVKTCSVSEVQLTDFQACFQCQV